MARSPMILQYLSIKDQHPDHILFFRLGDFYEMFFDDAKTVSAELDLVLTGRDCGDGERAPMCGVPYHACDAYVAKLISKGYKIAICEQMEDPTTVKGIVKREVIRIITPGTVMSAESLEDGKNNYIASIHTSSDGLGICFADITTGALYCLTDEVKNHSMKLINELGRFSPSEVIVSAGSKSIDEVKDFLNKKTGTVITYNTTDSSIDSCIRIVEDHFNKSVLTLGISGMPALIIALGGLLDYLYHTQMTSISNITDISFISEDQYMLLDINTRRNLELCESMRNGEKKGSLLYVIDKTKTPMGKRMLRSCLEKPLLNVDEINDRLDAVEELISDSLHLSQVNDTLSLIKDIERLSSRIAYKTAGSRELRALCQSIKPIPLLKQLLSKYSSNLISILNSSMDELDDICKLIDDVVVDEPPVSLRDGGMVKDGCNVELDELRNLLHNSKSILASIEERERNSTGIKNLKVKYNKVFGYYIDVTNMYKDLVPDYYIRKQTLVGGERYITEELKEIEDKILSADSKIADIEYSIITNLINSVGNQLSRLQVTSAAISMIDVLVSFANVSIKNRYCRPVISNDGITSINEGRHPVVEQVLSDSLFVPNDTYLNLNTDMISIITGPNMAGKSTYMRQVAIITIMAQIGCFVPAKSANIGITDKVFTRVGASDDLSMGQSTFMVEMSEVAYILKNATKNSLVIFDEIGRGTSTYDGMSIARAVIEFVSENIGCRTLFATHYHEITNLENIISGIRNYNVTVKKKDKLVFLRKIVRGRADDSYGIEVAELAGVPDYVTKHAKEILISLESNSGNIVNVQYQNKEQPVMNDLELEIINKIKNIEVDTLSPLEALNILYELNKSIRSTSND